MATTPNDDELDHAYVSGLLDTTGRVRFNLTQLDDTFTVRPELRIKHHGTQMRAAAISDFLESRDYTYELVGRERGTGFFLLHRRSDLKDLRDYLKGRSTHLIRELEFATGSLFERYDTEILDSEEAYRFLLIRDELRYGWRPRGRHHRPPDYISDQYDINTDEITVPSLPKVETDPDYTIEYIAGVLDGNCRYRLGITDSSELRIGFGMYPIARLYRGGVNSSLVNSVRQFCNNYDLKCSDSSESNTLRISFIGSNAIRRLLDVIFQQLLVLAEPSIALLDDILPRFDANRHREKQGFYNIVHDFEYVSAATGGEFSGRKYSPEYFADLWEEEIDIEHYDVSPRPNGNDLDAELDPLNYLEPITLSPEDYEDNLERYQSIVDRRTRDSNLVISLKEIYNDQCQVCGNRRVKTDGTGYSEVHHLQPLGEPHGGPDTLENMIVLCPNHHADFDNGVVWIDVGAKKVKHPYDPEADGKTITVEDGDNISETYLRYHNNVIANISTEE